MNRLKVLVAGCGNMGTSHARAYHQMEDFHIVGVVSRRPESRKALSKELGGIDDFSDFEFALRQTKPDVVSINTYPETHAIYAQMSMNAGAHVFCEKPLATNIRDAQKLVNLARESDRKLVVGYILRVHTVWKKFIEIAQTLGKPLVMRMNLNQQSSGEQWYTHKQLLASMSPIVDCGVHYVDVMCQMTGANPTRVSAIGARLSEEIHHEMYNYGQLQVSFDDGSVGWYESGWGPMMSETAFFVKDVIGPKGCASIIDQTGERIKDSEDVESHTKTGGILVHHSEVDDSGSFLKRDEWVDTSDEPDHDELCAREQAFLLRAIREDLDLSQHLNDAVNSLRIVLAADTSFREGVTVDL